MYSLHNLVRYSRSSRIPSGKDCDIRYEFDDIAEPYYLPNKTWGKYVQCGGQGWRRQQPHIEGHWICKITSRLFYERNWQGGGQHSDIDIEENHTDSILYRSSWSQTNQP